MQWSHAGFPIAFWMHFFILATWLVHHNPLYFTTRWTLDKLCKSPSFSLRHILRPHSLRFFYLSSNNFSFIFTSVRITLFSSPPSPVKDHIPTHKLVRRCLATGTLWTPQSAGHCISCRLMSHHIVYMSVPFASQNKLYLAAVGKRDAAFRRGSRPWRWFTRYLTLAGEATAPSSLLSLHQI